MLLSAESEWRMMDCPERCGSDALLYRKRTNIFPGLYDVWPLLTPYGASGCLMWLFFGWTVDAGKERAKRTNSSAKSDGEALERNWNETKKREKKRKMHQGLKRNGVTLRGKKREISAQSGSLSSHQAEKMVHGSFPGLMITCRLNVLFSKTCEERRYLLKGLISWHYWSVICK